MELKISRVTKQFLEKIAVDRVSLNMKPGVYGLLGANGAGENHVSSYDLWCFNSGQR